MIDGTERDKPQDGWRRPDASMSLLADLFSGKLLDPGYAEAAARRGDRPRRAAGRGGVLLALALVGLLLVAAGEQVRRSEPAAQRQRDRLVAEVKARTAESDGLQRGLDALHTETDRLRADTLARSEEGRTARDQLAGSADAAAARAVTGPALVVELRDARAVDANGPGNGRVYDQDLQQVVNGLWQAGATAIAINGERFTATTAIRTAGQAILVDYRPLLPPYLVTALGDPAALRDRFEESAAGGRLRDLVRRYQIRVDLRREGRVTLPAAPVSGQLRYAQEAQGGVVR